jgi:hypothetical protein
MSSPKYVDYIVSIAQEIESEDPIDWGMLAIDETAAYKLMSANVIDMFDKYDKSILNDMLVATVVKLVVENFTLQLKLQQRK